MSLKKWHELTGALTLNTHRAKEWHEFERVAQEQQVREGAV